MKRRLRKIKRLIKDSSGFTLVEAMISLAVFSIGILGMAALQTSSVNSNALAEDVQLNTVTAMAQIEELMATDFLDQRFNQNCPLIPPCGPSPDGRFNICVTACDDVAIPGAKRITVTSQFTPAGGNSQTITLDIFKPRIN